MSQFISAFVLPPDAEEQWLRFEEFVRKDAASFFDGPGPIAGARAPGRLDILGGVADYSGSIVLEMPIAEAAYVAWQWREDRLLRIRSIGIEGEGLLPEVSVSLDDLIDPHGMIRPVDEVHDRLTRTAAVRWAAYIAGCFYVMLAAYTKMSQGVADVRLGLQGANILVDSRVPLGAGVSSSAAIEVGTMNALSEAAGIAPSELTLAAWCQRVENLVVGAPCGIMDQVTSALGRKDSVLVMRCQPHDILGHQSVPPGWRFVGLDSRVKHSVGGSHYTKARIGAFMGLKIIQLESGGKLLENYLCRMSSSELSEYLDLIPEEITGAEYRRLYGQLPDRITRVDPQATYYPRRCAEHPILENERAQAFVNLMQIAEMRYAEFTTEEGEEPGPADPMRFELMRKAGDILYDAHASYSDRLNLGSPETDLLVQLIRERGTERGLYGARITGGGSGGTVAVLCTAESKTESALAEVCIEYQKQSGIVPRVFVGSSPGTLQFGSRQILRG